MNTNVCGVMAMTRTFLPLLKKRPDKAEVGANVINISSLLASVSLAVDSYSCTSYRYRLGLEMTGNDDRCILLLALADRRKLAIR